MRDPGAEAIGTGLQTSPAPIESLCARRIHSSTDASLPACIHHSRKNDGDPYSSGEFDIHEEPERFIKVVTGYANMSDAEFGLDTFTIDQKQVVKFSWTSNRRPCESGLLRLAHERGVKGVAGLVGYQRVTTIDEMRSGMAFPPPHRFKTAAVNASGSFSISRSFGAFQKLSVSTSKRKHDGEDRGNIERSRSMSNSRPSKLCQQPEAMQNSAKTNISRYETDSGRFCNRIFGCLAVSPAGRALRTFKSTKELLGALRGAIDGHRSLYVVGNILHRDISENNIITESTGTEGAVGMLIDLDLAKVVGSGRSGARHQTGTVEFMTIQVLQKVAHTYRHDLESFLYVLLWVCARRTWEVNIQCVTKGRPRRSILQKWYTGDFDEIAHAKQGDMHTDGFEDILKEFPPVLEHLKPLCRQLRKILFPLHQSGGLDTGTHTAAEELYSEVLNAYDVAIAKLGVMTGGSSRL